MNLNELLMYGKNYLLDANINDVSLKVRLLMEHTLNMNKLELIMNNTIEISSEKEYEFKHGLEKIKNNIPIQYITNHQEFMKLNFYVDENVLIPQPDTETLVEEVLKYAKTLDKPKILDLCTGSGAIAVSLAKYIENCEITATDISHKAVQIAKLNAERNLVHNKITFIESNMFYNIPETKYDIIVSNPPYIETNTINNLSQEVQNEPLIALDGGIDGLDFYRIIVDNCSRFLFSGGKLFVEIGYNQRDALFNMVQDSDYLHDFCCVKDLSGNDRVVICELL